MKKIYYLFAMLLFMPTLVNAKTVTCTSENDFTIGKNVYDGISVTCSEGEAQIFAVEMISGGLITDRAVNPHPAVANVNYLIEFVWTGTINSDVDTMLVDDDNLTDMTMGSCETGCHLYTKTSQAKPAINYGTGTVKEIAVGTIYYVGDSIKFNEVSDILYADEEDYWLEVDEGSYVLPSPRFTQDDNYSLWGFENFLKEYDESSLHGLYFGYNTAVSADRVPIGVKCIRKDSGDAYNVDKYAFELVYEDSNTNQEPNEHGDNNESETVEYTILEGANQTYTLGSDKGVVIKASGDKDKITAIEIDNGNPIDSKNYELATGSTILTLKSSFLEASSVGEHTITFKYNDGEVSTKLTVVEASNSNSDEEPANNPDENTTTDPETTNNGTNGNSGNNSNSNTNTTNNPQTGDNIMFYISLLGLSIIGFVGAGIYLKKKKFN